MKKNTSLLLVLIMLLGSMASCYGDQTGANETVSADPVQQETAAETEPELPVKSVPIVDFNGGAFHVLEVDSGDSDYLDFKADEETADPINNAVYERNMIIEELYNVHINTDLTADVSKTFSTLVAAGDSSYHLGTPRINNIPAIAIEKTVLDLREIPYLDLNSDLWEADLTFGMAINGIPYTTTGNISTDTAEYSQCILFNKSLVKDNDLESPYTLIDNNQWTLDAWHQMGAAVSTDVDGDGKYSAADILSVSNDISNFYVFFNGTGERYAVLDADNLPQITVLNERANNVLAKLAEMYKDPEFFYQVNKLPEGWTSLRLMFQGDQVFSMFTQVYQVRRYREMETDFGIVPLPKYDEAQESYHHVVATHAAKSLVIPVTAEDTEMIGIMLQALAEKSEEILKPTYYEKLLTGKFARDEQSGAYLDMIFTTKMYDLGYIFNWGNLTTVVDKTVGSNRELAAAYASMEKSVTAALEKTIAAYQE